MSVSESILREGLKTTLESTSLSDLGERIEGKVRDSYLPGDGTRILVVTDRISAFDRVLGTLPFKGQVLNRLSGYWFEATKDVAPNHVKSVPDPNVTIGLECTPFPVEFVVRAYLTGVTSTSIWTHYSRGERVYCGHRLPDGLTKHQRLPQTLLTPSTKAPKGGHDVSTSRAEIIASGAMSEADYDEACRIALALFARGEEMCLERGLLMVDTKYEMGRTPDGRIAVIDEIHTPDSTRLWYADKYDAQMAKGEDPIALDKEFVRRFLVAQGYIGEGAPPPLPDDVRIEAARRYIEAYEIIRGEPFVPNREEPISRIRKALQAKT